MFKLPNNQYQNDQQESSLQKGAFAALQRAAEEAKRIAIQTNTAIIINIDGEVKRIDAEMLKNNEMKGCSIT